MNVIQTIAQIDDFPIIIFNAWAHAAITAIDSNVLPFLLETEGAIIIVHYNPNVDSSIPTEGSITTNGHISTHIIVSCLFTGQGLIVGRVINDHTFSISNRRFRIGIGRFLSHLVERHLKSLISGGIICLVSAPVTVLLVPLHVVTTAGVLDIIEAISKGDNFPLVIDSIKIHAGKAFTQTNILIVLLETIGAVFVIHHCPDLCSTITSQNIIRKRNFDAQIVITGFLAGQSHIIGRGIDDHLVASLNGGLGCRLILFNNGILKRLHRAVHAVQDGHGFQNDFCTNCSFNFGLVVIAVLCATRSGVVPIQGIVDGRPRCCCAQSDLRTGGHFARLRRRLRRGNSVLAGFRADFRFIQCKLRWISTGSARNRGCLIGTESIL
nr:hypothetical protein [Flavonifractor sp.]